jgi:hypothetical protein
VSDNPFVFDRAGRLAIHKRLMRTDEPYPLQWGSRWYIVHRAADGVHMQRWVPDGPMLHLGQQVAARSHLPKDLEEAADAAERSPLAPALVALRQIEQGAFDTNDECRYCGTDFEDAHDDWCPLVIASTALGSGRVGT